VTTKTYVLKKNGQRKKGFSKVIEDDDGGVPVLLSIRRNELTSQGGTVNPELVIESGTRKWNHSADLFYSISMCGWHVEREGTKL
jgi:hypothetical protein